jgi:hypothetical protein
MRFLAASSRGPHRATVVQFLRALHAATSATTQTPKEKTS